MADIPPAFPDGHFYSPVVDVQEALRDQGRIWPVEPARLGIDLNPRGQRAFLTGPFARYIRDYQYPEYEDANGNGFYTRNSQFSWLDARALFVMLRTVRPRRMIEVGSGFSSLLTADVNRRWLNGKMHFSCIEPSPRPFLVAGVPGITQLIQRRVQDVPLSHFASLRRDDVLFIDSSHVSKTGSDVNHLLFEVIPRLRVGVIIHFHDIFLPSDYPKDWVLEEGRSWNEQYLVAAMLMFTKAFEVMFGSNYVFHHYPRLLSKLLGGACYGGGSLWIKRHR